MGKQALPYNRQNLWLVDPDDLVIVEDEGHHLFDPTRTFLPVDEAMALNVMVYGVIEPVSGRKNPEGQVEVIDGRRRVKAAREANRRLAAEGKAPIRVPVVLKAGDPSRLYGVMVSANEHRLDDTVLSKARKAARHFDMGADKGEVANAFGVSTVTIDNWLKLLSADPALIAEVEKGNISASAATEVAGKPKAQKALLARAQKGEGKKRERIASTSARPGQATIRKALVELRKQCRVKDPPLAKMAMATALGWVLGAVSEDEFQAFISQADDT